MAKHAVDRILSKIDELDNDMICEMIMTGYQEQVSAGGYSAWKAYAIENNYFATLPDEPLLDTTLDFQNCVWDLLEPSFLERLQCKHRELQARKCLRCELSQARPSGSGVTCAEQAIAAVHRFTQHQGAHLEAETAACGGSGGGAFVVRVDDTDSTSGIAYFVKVATKAGHRQFLSDESIANEVETTALLGRLGLGPTVLGSDADAFVQNFVDGKELPPLCKIAGKNPDMLLPLSQSIGKVIARVHSLPCEEDAIVSPQWKWWALLPEQVQKLPCEQQEPLIALYNCINSWPQDRGIGGERVLIHGDFHQKNVLRLNPSPGSDGQSASVELNVIDMELCGSHYRAFDLAFFFWHWDWKYMGGEDKYPNLAVRRTFAQSYLLEAGFNGSDDELNSFLWEVEFESLRIALWRHVTCVQQGKVVSALGYLTDLLNAVKEDSVGSSKMKQDCIEDGLLQYASAAANRTLSPVSYGGA